MEYEKLHGKKVQVFFKPRESFGEIYFYGPDDIKTGELRIANGHYELYQIMFDINFSELIWESPYIFYEDQIDLIRGLN